MCIKASNFSFRYSKNLPYILKDLNFTINKGKVTSITGQNGAGKSTLAMVIGGLYKLNKKNSQGEIKKGENI
ncbi:MAG: ATP-binding cassette domain-containing protein, partial [Candidatus Ancillula sp.]|nr:ATP-binding cassette domain-containing protein [Candidatus Ancillula sp.]